MLTTLFGLPEISAGPVASFRLVLLVSAVVAGAKVCSALFVFVLSVVGHRAIPEMNDFDIAFVGSDEDRLLFASGRDSLYFSGSV